MLTVAEVRFGPYRLELARPRLWKGQDSVALQPKPLAVLAHLAVRPGAVVDRDELIRTVWADTHVTRAVVKVAVRAIREALGDDVASPRYIETVGRRGYRFVGMAAFEFTEILTARRLRATGPAPTRAVMDTRERDHRPSIDRPPLPFERVFVVQLRGDVDSTVAGRIEHLSSGVCAMFDSVDELIAWMGDAIARDAARPAKRSTPRLD
jgi:DNA-binding winged helix-turn-helix (wHTH) protein